MDSDLLLTVPELFAEDMWKRYLEIVLHELHLLTREFLKLFDDLA